MEDDKLTLFYSKQTGDIKAFCTGEQNMSFFGINEEEFKITYDFIIISYNNDIIRNKNNYYVNLENKTLITK